MIIGIIGLKKHDINYICDKYNLIKISKNDPIIIITKLLFDSGDNYEVIEDMYEDFFGKDFWINILVKKVKKNTLIYNIKSQLEVNMIKKKGGIIFSDSSYYARGVNYFVKNYKDVFLKLK